MDPGKMETIIKSTTNPKVKLVRKLHKRSEREASGLFVIEGLRELHAAFKGGVEIVEVFFHPESLGDERAVELAGKISSKGIKLTPVSLKVLKKISYRESAAAFVAVAKRPAFRVELIPRSKSSLYLVADSIEKPGNMGAVLRTADGCGASGVIMTPERSDPLNPNTIRSSLGTVFSVPVAVTSEEEAIEYLKGSGTTIIAAVPDADELYTHVDMRGASAIVVGSEDRGVSAQWLDAADRLVRIPMKGRCDSLNVSVSAAVIMYEALRQRMARNGKSS